jgi:hypothetical protein
VGPEAHFEEPAGPRDSSFRSSGNALPRTANRAVPWPDRKRVATSFATTTLPCHLPAFVWPVPYGRKHYRSVTKRSPVGQQSGRGSVARARCGWQHRAVRRADTAGGLIRAIRLRAGVQGNETPYAGLAAPLL